MLRTYCSLSAIGPKQRDPILNHGTSKPNTVAREKLWPLVDGSARDQASGFQGTGARTISHGQGTAQAATENQLSGAVAGVAMGLGAVRTSLAAPWIVPLLLR
jgi:hypothetical protein